MFLMILSSVKGLSSQTSGSYQSSQALGQKITGIVVVLGLAAVLAGLFTGLALLTM